jgi:hypothetical protein
MRGRKVFGCLALEGVGSLEKEMAHMETWNTEKERYELKDVGYGSRACVVKEAPGSKKKRVSVRLTTCLDRVPP